MCPGGHGWRSGRRRIRGWRQQLGARRATELRVAQAATAALAVLGAGLGILTGSCRSELPAVDSACVQPALRDALPAMPRAAEMPAGYAKLLPRSPSVKLSPRTFCTRCIA